MKVNSCRFDVVGLGQCCIDFISIVSSLPERNEKAETGPFMTFGGGPAATAMVTLSRLGMKTALVGVTGDDHSSRFIREEMIKEGVDISYLVERKDHTSQAAFIAVDKDTAERTIFWNRGSSFPLNPNEINLNLIQSSRFLHLDGLHLEASIAAAVHARKSGVKTMLDCGTYRDGIEELIPYIDYVIAGYNFARHFSYDMKDALSRIANISRGITGVTLGEKGSMVRDTDGKIYFQKAFEVDSIDTTGCGDAFHGGFIYGVLNGLDLSETIEFASAVAALKTLKAGGRAGLPTRMEVDCFLRSKLFS